jgi:hypothetical protein
MNEGGRTECAAALLRSQPYLAAKGVAQTWAAVDATVCLMAKK